MNNYPEYAEVNGKLYKINTDFRVALKCSQVSENDEIDDTERALTILYLLFGKEALKDENTQDSEKLLNVAKKYLACGQELKKNKEKPDMDFIEDYTYIKTSFRSDYGINLDKEKMHWWEFYELINGLSNSETGNCCILNRIRNLRNYDTSKIKDRKERQKIEEAKKNVELKRNSKRQKLTPKQKESVENIKRILGI